ncbi:MAG: nucleotidyltransferase domain-containing protein [Bacteroidales bacterium]|nr:nucleotidyltransferase domain-containing protein [Bacteroidales bacterium]
MFKPDIRHMRLARGMTQEQVGILAGMSKSQISRMESGKLGSPDTYSRVLAALGYRPVVSYIDERRGDKLDRDAVLSLLKVYYIYNKQALGIESLALFGSFARNEAGPQSDIDILVSLEKPDLYRYYTLSKQLETVLGRKIDLVSAKSHFQEGFIENINKDLIYVTD